MSRPTRLKRRSRPTLGDRVRTYWAIGLFLAFAAGYGAWLLSESPALRLHRLVVTGNVRVSREDIVAHAAVDPRANVWLLDVRAIAKRVEAIPFVAHASVKRRPPADVTIEISERAPEGCVRGADFEFEVDAQERVLTEGCPDTRRVFLARSIGPAPAGRFLNNPELAQLERDARILSAGSRRLNDFRLDEYGDLEARLESGIRVRFGDDDDLPRKEDLIGPILASLGPKAAAVTAIDLRAPEAPVVERGPVMPRSSGLSTSN